MAEKKYDAREASITVLNKVREILAESELAKSERLVKYATEMKKEPSNPPKDPSKKLERDYTDYEEKSGKSKTSDQKRLTRQISPSKNPKEFAEGNNKPDGMEPKYEFKSQVPKELAKENKASMGKAENPDKEADAKLGEKVEHEVERHFEENKEAEKKEGHKLMTKSSKMDKHGLSPEQIKSKMKKGEMDKHGLSPEQIKSKLKKGETKHDRCVEHVKENSPDVHNPDAVCSSVGVPRGKSEEMQGEKAFIPYPGKLSAKLAKFCEYKHAKRKAAMSSPEEAQSHAMRGTPDEHAGEQHEQSMHDTINETSEGHGHGDKGPREDWQGRAK